MRAKKHLLQLFALLAICSIQPIAFATDTLSFQSSWQKVLQHNPQLKAADWETKASFGDVVQSKILPNPSLGVTMENFAGGGAYHGSAMTETTYQLSQPILLGNKLSTRKELAQSNYKLQNARVSALRSTLYTTFAKSFIDVLVAEAWVKICKKTVDINQQIVTNLNKKKDIGKASTFDLDRAEVGMGDADIQLLQAQTQLQLAKTNLAGFWGENTMSPDTVLTEAGLPHQLPTESLCHTCLLQSPILQQTQASIASATAKIAVNDSDAWPDLTAGVGVRHFNETHDNALVADLSIPLPLFNRNQGNRMAAKAQYYQAQAEADSVKITLQQQVTTLYHTAKSAQRDMQLTKNKLLPKARNALQLATDGYLQGRYSYLELTSAQQQFLTEEHHYWQAHAAYDKAQVELMAILGSCAFNQRGTHA